MSLVLIVDDEPHVRKIMRELLSHAGHECLEAENVDVALEVMEKRPAARRPARSATYRCPATTGFG